MNINKLIGQSIEQASVFNIKFKNGVKGNVLIENSLYEVSLSQIQENTRYIIEVNEISANNIELLPNGDFVEVDLKYYIENPISAQRHLDKLWAKEMEANDGLLYDLNEGKITLKEYNQILTKIYEQKNFNCKPTNNTRQKRRI